MHCKNRHFNFRTIKPSLSLRSTSHCQWHLHFFDDLQIEKRDQENNWERGELLRRCYHAHEETYSLFTRNPWPNPCAAPTTPAHAVRDKLGTIINIFVTDSCHEKPGFRLPCRFLNFGSCSYDKIFFYLLLIFIKLNSKIYHHLYYTLILYRSRLAAARRQLRNAAVSC